MSDFSRFRLATEPALGRLTLEATYEHAATVRRRRQFSGVGVGIVPGGGEWLDLQWTIADREHVLWQHRFDRLRVGWSPNGSVDLDVGRQAVSWGTTLLLTPADPFLPFNPADPFREFRAGVDAARLRIYPSPLSEVDIVVRPTDTEVGEEVTALARGLATWRNWELSGWAGSLYGDTTAAFAAAGAIGAWAVRTEAVVRDRDEWVVFRGAVGLDRQLQVGGRDLSLAFEYQRDGLGASRPEDYVSLFSSDTFLRGEHQTWGRDEVALQGSYQVHPLLSMVALWLVNANDGSSLLAPSVSYSVSDEAAISGGVYVGFGDHEATPMRPVASEYGLSGTTLFVSVSVFF